jgi:signal transduction histidine kinase
MEERAHRLGAALEIRSSPGTGTIVHLEAPHG